MENQTNQTQQPEAEAPKPVDLNRATGTPTVAVIGAIRELFEYQTWDEKQTEAGNIVRNSLSSAYQMIIAVVPPSPTRTRALNKLVDARMLANAAITHKGRF